jgi:hypothetical protein
VTAIWLLRVPESEWRRVAREVHRYGINLAHRMGPVARERRWEWPDDKWDAENARVENDWCVPQRN